MPSFDVDGYGMADHTILVDSTGYVHGDGSTTTVTLANIPDGFTIIGMDREGLFELDDLYGISIRVCGDLELDAFRRSIEQLALELDNYLGVTMKERDRELDNAFRATVKKLDDEDDDYLPPFDVA